MIGRANGEADLHSGHTYDAIIPLWLLAALHRWANSEMFDPGPIIRRRRDKYTSAGDTGSGGHVSRRRRRLASGGREIQNPAETRAPRATTSVNF